MLLSSRQPVKCETGIWMIGSNITGKQQYSDAISITNTITLTHSRMFKQQNMEQLEASVKPLH